MSSTRRRGLVLGSTAAMTLALAYPGIAFAAGSSSGPHVVEAAPTWTAHSAKVAVVPASTPQHLTVVLNMRHEQAAEALATVVSDPSSAQYGHYVTASQWRSQFAPTAQQVAQVTKWLTSQGLHIGAIPANHRYINASGTTAQVNKALGTQLAVFHKAGKSVAAPAQSMSAPATIAPLVAGISGLDGSAKKTPLSIGGPETTQQSKSTATRTTPDNVLPPPDPVFKNATPCSTYYGQKAATTVPQILQNPLTYAPCGYVPAQIRGAYGVDQSLQQGYDGRGATVAVVDAYASPYILKDATTYAKRNDPNHPLRSYQFSQSLPASYSHIDECGASGWYGEETLDVEAVHATAPSANILYVGASSCYDTDLDAAVNTVVDNDLAQVVTNSYGDTGEPTSVADVQAEHQTAIQAAAQGISLLFSAGDSGDEIANTGTRQVDYEASDPFVTAVGGTALAVGAGNNYLFEQGWGTGKSTLKDGAWAPLPPAYLYGGGGGTSQLFKQPRYQKKVVPPSISNYFGTGKHRAVPDVAMVGDPNTGFLVGQSQTFPNGQVKYSEYRIGGTSLSSPLFAGMTAVADQWNGGSLGFLNPRIYSLAGTDAFRDIDHGRAVTDGVVRVDFVNGFNKKDGTVTSLRTLGQTGTIFTRPGYDDVTGVGSPNGMSFFAAMSGGSGQTSSGHGPSGGTVHGTPSR